MCEPTTIAMVGMGVLGAAQTALSIQSSNNMAAAAANAANAAAGADYNALMAEREELDRATAVNSIEVQREMMRRRASIRVAQGEAGVMGVTPLRELANVELQGSLDMATLEMNRESKMAQSARAEGKIAATRQGRVNEAKGKMTSGWAAGLQIGTAAVGGAWQGYQMGSVISPRNPASSAQARINKYSKLAPIT